MRRLLRDIAEGKTLGDTTTLADPAVVAKLKDQYEKSGITKVPTALFLESRISPARRLDGVALEPDVAAGLDRIELAVGDQRLDALEMSVPSAAAASSIEISRGGMHDVLDAVASGGLRPLQRRFGLRQKTSRDRSARLRARAR